MMADTEPVKGWLREGEVFCADCGGDDDDCTLYEGESDSPVHCSVCGVPIIHALTAEGVDYVRNTINGCCREVWPTLWGIMPRIPIDSIVIPGEFINLCEDWEGGVDCMLRAITSTGNLTIGTHRPRGCDTDEKWYLTIWRNLAADVYSVVRMASNGLAYPGGHDDVEALYRFELWVDEQVERLEESYGLADWDPSDD